jgi:hypothetical protein
VLAEVVTKDHALGCTTVRLVSILAMATPHLQLLTASEVATNIVGEVISTICLMLLQRLLPFSFHWSAGQSQNTPA